MISRLFGGVPALWASAVLWGERVLPVSGVDTGSSAGGMGTSPMNIVLIMAGAVGISLLARRLARRGPRGK